MTPDKKDSDLYRDALITASRNGHTKIVDLLLNIGVDPHDSKDHCKALFESVRKSHFDIIDRLLQCKLSTVAVSTACCRALERDHFAIVDRLLKMDLDQEALDKIYCVAEKKKNTRIMSLIELKGTNMVVESFPHRW